MGEIVECTTNKLLISLVWNTLQREGYSIIYCDYGGRSVYKEPTLYYITMELYLLTYLLTPWSRVLLEKLTGLQLVKKFPPVLWNQKVPHRTHKRPPPVPILSQPNPVLTTTPHFLKIHSNIILPSMPGSPQRSLSLGFPHQNPVHTSPFPHTFYMPRPSHSRFYHPHDIGWNYGHENSFPQSRCSIIILSYKPNYFNNVCIRSVQVLDWRTHPLRLQKDAN
jgi:hypothetical protein